MGNLNGWVQQLAQRLDYVEDRLDKLEQYYEYHEREADLKEEEPC